MDVNMSHITPIKFGLSEIPNSIKGYKLDLYPSMGGLVDFASILTRLIELRHVQKVALEELGP
jgi:hypothetical protein